MGSSASKAARTAAGSATRKYPSRAPGSNPTMQPAAASNVQRQGRAAPSAYQASSSRTEAIDADARDPHLDASLRSIGPVQPNPTYSASSTASPTPYTSSQAHSIPRNNPALMTLEARSRISAEAEQEKIDFGQPGFTGRRFLDVPMIRKALALRDEQGMQSGDVEKALKLKPGTLEKLGAQGMVEGA